ncbi:hypothetical protein GWI33_008892, partial [Rhynchophorus ferrugineus]
NKSGDSRRMVDITRDKPIKVAVRVVVPVRDHPKVSLIALCFPEKLISTIFLSCLMVGLLISYSN